MVDAPTRAIAADLAVADMLDVLFQARPGDRLDVELAWRAEDGPDDAC
jgi:hypothetical protein